MRLFETVLGRVERGTNEILSSVSSFTSSTPSPIDNLLSSGDDSDASSEITHHHQQDPSSTAVKEASNSLDLLDSPVEAIIHQLVNNGSQLLHIFNNNQQQAPDHLQLHPIHPAPVNATTNDTAMIVVDEAGIRLFKLDELLTMLLLSLSVSFIVIGGAIPYVFQYAEIYRRKSAVGFSLLVCLALCIANILRIEFWIGKRFELPLLVQSVVMLAVMVGMLEISVRMNRRMIPVTQRTSIFNGDFIDAFWKWNDLASFIVALALFTVVVSLLNAVFHENVVFVESIGMGALLVEACLGIPQLVRNFQRKSTIGMSVKMVLMWFIGDVGKTIYFVVRASPAQFWICSCLQITIDVLILLQVWVYGRRASAANGGGAHGMRIPSYVSSSASTKA